MIDETETILFIFLCVVGGSLISNSSGIKFTRMYVLIKTASAEILKLVRSAGIKWLALGIESGDKSVRLEVDKGKFEDVDVKKVIERVHESDINVMANYIYGLPGDTRETIEKTYKLSLELCTAGWNTYGAMALPGSLLYKNAIEKGIKLPETYEGYSFHAYETLPLPTEKLTAKEIITLRDEAFDRYHNHKPFLALIIFS